MNVEAKDIGMRSSRISETGVQGYLKVKIKDI
jgi:hypothetical protein